MSSFTVRTVIKEVSEKLSGLYPVEEIQSFQRIILEKIFQTSIHKIYLDLEKNISNSEYTEITGIVNHLKTGYPIQYLIGEVEFYGLPIRVKPGVLIPRPETEELVDLVIRSLPKNQLKVLDIGTGSGCIAIALAKNLSLAEVYAIDFSEEALLQAKGNAILNDVCVHFSSCNILNPVDLPNGAPFDVIVTNPPYVRRLESKNMKSNVLDHEPHIALFVDDDDPLSYYNAIAQKAYKLMNSGGILFCEINEALGKETAAVFAENSFFEVKVLKDINGKDRFLSALFYEKI